MSALSSSPSPSPSSSTTTTMMSSCFYILSLISISLLISASASASPSISILGGSSILVTAFSTTTTTTTISYNNNNKKNNKNRQQQQQYRRSFSNDNNGSSQQFLSSSSASSALTLAACDISSAMELPVVNELISSYGYCLKNHFFPTQSITNAVLTMVGDGFAQSKENSDNNNSNNQEQQEQLELEQQQQQNQESVYDPKRGMTYFFKGLGSGILWAIWFEQADVLSKELTQSTLSHYHIPSLPSQQQHIETALQTIISILMEQFLICPILFATWDIPITSIMSGTDVKQIPKQIDDKLIPLLTANAKVWTLVNVITYNIPLQYRLLFTSGASIVSETINSGITSKQGIEVERTPVPVPVPVVPQQQTRQIISNKRNLGETTIDRTTTPVLATATTIAATTVGGGGGRMKLRSTNSTFVAL